jgi:hypothetical protein
LYFSLRPDEDGEFFLEVLGVEQKMNCIYPDCGKEITNGYFKDGVGQCDHCHRILYADEFENEKAKYALPLSLKKVINY